MGTSFRRQMIIKKIPVEELGFGAGATVVLVMLYACSPSYFERLRGAGIWGDDHPCTPTAVLWHACIASPALLPRGCARPAYLLF